MFQHVITFLYSLIAPNMLVSDVERLSSTTNDVKLLFC